MGIDCFLFQIERKISTRDFGEIFDKKTSKKY